MDKIEAQYFSNGFDSLIYENIPESKVFSRSYCRNVLFNMRYSEPFTLFFGDFNKLGRLNSLHGFDYGTTCLNNSLKVLLSSFPSSTIAARLGGDEFIFIVPDSSMERNPREYIEQINSKLSSNSKFTGGLSICLASSHNSLDKNTFDTFLKAEENVENLKVKNLSNTDREHSWESLDELLDCYLSKYFESFRLSPDLKMDVDEFYSKTAFIMREANSLLKKGIYLPPIDVQDKIVDKIAPDITPETLQALHSFFTTGECYEDLRDDDFLLLRDYLSIDSLTELYTDSHFKSFTIPNLEDFNSNYKVLYYSITGLKISNYIHGHEQTDVIFSNMCKKIKDNIEHNVGRPSHLIDFRGGNFVGIFPANSEITPQNLQDTFDIQTPEEFNVVYSFANSKGSNLLQTINNLDETCASKKHNIKASMLKSEPAKKLLGILLSPCVVAYMSTIDNPEDPSNKRQFLKRIFDTIAGKYSDCIVDDKIPDFKE